MKKDRIDTVRATILNILYPPATFSPIDKHRAKHNNQLNDLGYNHIYRKICIVLQVECEVIRIDLLRGFRGN